MSFVPPSKYTTSAVNGFSKPGDQGIRIADEGEWSAARLFALKIVLSDHPRPKGPHASRCALVRPKHFNWSRVHSFALLRLGEPVSRGPITSVSVLSVSITCEWFMPSSRMRAIGSLVSVELVWVDSPYPRGEMVSVIAAIRRGERNRFMTIRDRLGSGQEDPTKPHCRRQRQSLPRVITTVGHGPGTLWSAAASEARRRFGLCLCRIHLKPASQAKAASRFRLPPHSISLRPILANRTPPSATGLPAQSTRTVFFRQAAITLSNVSSTCGLRFCWSGCSRSQLTDS